MACFIEHGCLRNIVQAAWVASDDLRKSATAMSGKTGLLPGPSHGQPQRIRHCGIARVQGGVAAGAGCLAATPATAQLERHGSVHRFNAAGALIGVDGGGDLIVERAEPGALVLLAGTSFH